MQNVFIILHPKSPSPTDPNIADQDWVLVNYQQNPLPAYTSFKYDPGADNQTLEVAQFVAVLSNHSEGLSLAEISVYAYGNESHTLGSTVIL